ncbi:MAG: hypothetical protein FJW40_15280 [Acidobacteria bacterium]|nr:hypothetical protein [Acidobacteriota bacterium]
MGFALWVVGDIAYAEGTHEYRPMGAAVVSAATVVTAGDFRPHARSIVRSRRHFEGYFASLGHLNHHLKRRRGASAGDGRILPTL